jgi:flagellar hook assembly protein FlgD
MCAYVEMPNDGNLVVQGGKLLLVITLPETALSTTLYVKDKDGDVVATVGGTTTKGLNRIVWDGKLDDGTTAPNGVYSFSITAKNSKGEAMSLDDIRVVGYVTGIETETDGTISLKAGDLSINDTAVTSVFAYINAAKGDSAGATDETEDTAEDTTTTTDDSTG